MKILSRFGVVAVFLAILAGFIGYSRGYRFDFEKKSILPTGIIATSSSPRASKVYVNGVLKGVTDLNLTLPPDRYFIEVKKEGYSTWSKEISLKGELVMIVDPVLFPLNPSLSPLTNLGVSRAVALDASEKILLMSENGDDTKDGIYLFETAKRPLSFLPPLKKIILKKDIPNSALIHLTDSRLWFSPDYRQFIIEFDNTGSPTPPAYLFSTESENQQPFDTSLSKDNILEAWSNDRIEQNTKILQTFPPQFAKVASDAAQIIAFSPDEYKLLYKAKKNTALPLINDPPLIAANQTSEERTLKKDTLYVYDKKEDKNYPISFELVLPSVTPIPRTNVRKVITPTKVPPAIEVEEIAGSEGFPVVWYADSKHLIYNNNNKFLVSDYDGSNRQTVYSGPFDKSFFTTTSDGKIIVLANLNPENNQYPDLYVVGIR